MLCKSSLIFFLIINKNKNNLDHFITLSQIEEIIYDHTKCRFMLNRTKLYYYVRLKMLLLHSLNDGIFVFSNQNPLKTMPSQRFYLNWVWRSSGPHRWTQHLCWTSAPGLWRTKLLLNPRIYPTLSSNAFGCLAQMLGVLAANFHLRLWTVPTNQLRR